MSLPHLCSRIIRFGFYLLFILVPLILTPWNYELFEYNKMMITYALAAIIGGAWAIKMIAEKEVAIAKTPLDIPIVLFVGSQLVSAIFSMDPHVSWLGYYSRFNGGMWSIFTYVLLYYAFVSTIHASEVFGVFLSMIWTAVVVAIYGVLERLGIDKQLWVQDVQNRVFSTLGQPNWLAAYLVALIPLAIGIAISAGKSLYKASMYGAVTILFFVVLLFTRSRSGLVGLALADIVFWICLMPHWNKQTAIRTSAIILHLLFAVIIFFNGSNISQLDKHFTLSGITAQYRHTTPPQVEQKPTGPVLESGGTESGTIRKYVWQGALRAWRSTTKTFLIGTGTETFAFAFYKFRPAAHNLTSEWDFLYNKAHNEYLNYLATTGTFGLLSYLSLLCVFCFWFVAKALRAAHHDELSPLSIGLFAGWLSILVTNFFGFSVVIVQLMLFLFPAMIFVLTPKKTLFTRSLRLPRWTMHLVVVSVLVCCLRIALYWYADTLYATGYRNARSGQQSLAKQSLERAIALNPSEPNYHDELATTLATIAVGLYQQEQATQAAEFAKLSLSENARALTISPLNVNYWKSKTKIYYSFSSLNPAFITEAINALSKAHELSPNDPKIEYNLAILYGRQGDSTNAVSLLRHAIELKPNYHDAYYALYVFYTELKQPQLATEILQTYVQTIDQKDEQFTKILKGVSQ